MYKRYSDAINPNIYNGTRSNTYSYTIYTLNFRRCVVCVHIQTLKRKEKIWEKGKKSFAKIHSLNSIKITTNKNKK